MKGCLKPIAVTRGNSDLLTTVRCGRCRYCRLRRKQHWVGRLFLESLDHMHARFLTLTYRDDPGILDYRDCQLFLKAYRERTSRFRYFAVGEYGAKTGRGHWHLIIFGHAPKCVGPVDNPAWRHGFSYDGTVTPQSIGYVAGYSLKDVVRGKPAITKMSLQPGIGLPRICIMAQLLAREYKSKGLRLTHWPASYTLSGKNYPLTDGAGQAFQREFVSSGGVPPLVLSEDDSHIIAMEELSDFASLREKERLANKNYWSQEWKRYASTDTN